MKRKRKVWASLLLAVLLVGAQFGAALHAFKHDPGTPQSKVCTTCVTAAQLGAASTDHHAQAGTSPHKRNYSTRTVFVTHSEAVVVFRPRGPPTPL